MTVLDSDFKSLLKTVNFNTPLDKLQRVAASLKDIATVDDAVPVKVIAAEVNKAADLLQAQIDSLKNDIMQASNLLAVYQAENDKLIPQIKMIMESAINDFKSAIDASNEYNRQWFQRALLSENGKIEIAEHLISLISKYTKSNLETLRMIVERDPDVMDSIRVPDED